MHEFLFACKLWHLPCEPARCLACLPSACLLAKGSMQTPSLFWYGSSSVGAASCLLVAWHVLGCVSKGFSLLGGNALVAALCELFSISIGHSENVVGLHSLVGSTVAWNWFAEGETSLLGLDTEEHIVGLLEGLALALVDLEVRHSVVVEGLGVLLEVLVGDNVV